MVTKFAGVQKCLTHWMKTKKKENMTLDDSLLISASYIIIFFYKNDTNEVKGLYHDDCLEKRKKNILHIELGHGG